MKQIIADFKQWKLENPDKDYQYDCIFDFVDNLGRGDILSFFEDVEEMVDKNGTII